MIILHHNAITLSSIVHPPHDRMHAHACVPLSASHAQCLAQPPAHKFLRSGPKVGWTPNPPPSEPCPQIPTLAPLTNLLALTLAGNPVSRSCDYRRLVCASLPSLSSLDDAEVRPVDQEPQCSVAGDAADAATTATRRGGSSVVISNHSGGSEQAAAGSEGRGGQASGLEGRGCSVGVRGGGEDEQHAAQGEAETGSCDVEDGRIKDNAACCADGGSAAAGAAGEAVASSELDMVHEGIKRARVGMDSHEFREMEMAVLLDAQGGGEEEEEAGGEALGGPAGVRCAGSWPCGTQPPMPLVFAGDNV